MSTVENIYAESLISIDTIPRTEIFTDLSTVKEVFESSKELYDVLISPMTNYETKSLILEDIFKKEISPQVLNFLKIIAEKNKFKEFDGIVKAFKEKSDELEGIKHITVTSAIELKDEYKKLITDKLNKKLNKKTETNWITDENIIGGLIIKIDDNIIDTSVKNKLDKLMKGNV